MDAQLKAKWVEALRGGKYKQGSGWLEKDGAFCCLGVLCAIQDDEWKFYWTNDSMYTERLPDELNAGLADEDRHELAQMNDGGKTFAEIADYIEANL